MPGSLRAVLDTNVLLAAHLSSHPASPTAEILDRWQRREFVFLHSLDTLAERIPRLGCDKQTDDESGFQ
jgi:predicted nucleic acid-binding protein